MELSYVVGPKKLDDFCFIVSYLWCRCVKYSTLYEGDGLRWSTFAGCLWEMELNLSLDLSFGNM
jgi:hypothetical protein